MLLQTSRSFEAMTDGCWQSRKNAIALAIALVFWILPCSYSFQARSFIILPFGCHSRHSRRSTVASPSPDEPVPNVPATEEEEDGTAAGWTKFQFPDSLVQSLDLKRLVHHVAAHAATRRGREALLFVVGTSPVLSSATPNAVKRLASSESRGKSSVLWYNRRQQQLWQTSASTDRPFSRRTGMPPPPFRSTLGISLPEIRREYDRVEQATLVLQGWHNLSLPPLYGATGSTTNSERDNSLDNNVHNPWSVEFAVESDDDEWLYCEDVEDITLVHILQAEQILRMLLRVSDWSVQANVAHWAPSLGDLGRIIDRKALTSALHTIQSTVEVARVRSISDPTARSTFQFQLNGTTFPVLGLLRDKVEELQSSAQRSMSTPKNRRLSDFLEEIQVKEREILQGLALALFQCRHTVQSGLNAVAELDVIVSKAAFGLALNGQIPLVESEGRIDVHQFVHPLLVLEATSRRSTRVVPIDLRLSGDKRVLTITGMNGGGKSVALKSFGIAACLVRMAIPVPTMKGTSRPRVDFFDTVLTSIGDGQDVSRGESTFTAQLNTYSRIVDAVSQASESAHLVLLDELGAGTEANAGGAIGQAILEHLHQLEQCRTVLTTHSARLKAVSFRTSTYECAAVRQSTHDDDNPYRRPMFQLQYGVIGESYAMGAAARCHPPMPAHILDRASELAQELGSESNDSAPGEYLRALEQSLDRQIRLTEQLAANAQEELAKALACRRAMLGLANAYDRHLSFLQRRVEDCYQRIKETGDDSLTISGNTLNEIRVTRKQVKSEAERLREQGLKVLSDSYKLQDGESVVVIAEGEWNGLTGRVTRTSSSASLGGDVLVVMSVNRMDDWLSGAEPSPSDKSMDDRTIPFKRYQLAVWDYDSVWEIDCETAANDGPTTSIQDTRRRLFDVLASIRSSSGTSEVKSKKDNPTGNAYQSSRKRKASKPLRKKR